MQIILITTLYLEANEKRWCELVKCLEQNIESSVDYIYIIVEKIELETLIHEVPKAVRKCEKIVWCHTPSRQTFKMAFEVAKYHYHSHEDGMTIVANSDIFFRNEDLDRIRTYENMGKDKAICLSRWDVDSNCENEVISEELTQSQDAWIFKGIVREGCVSDFCFGMPNCDHRIAAELKAVGYELYNVPYNIKALHLHASGIRHYDQYADSVPGFRMGVEPGTDEELIGYKWVDVTNKNEKGKQRVVLACFASEGPPHDTGLPLADVCFEKYTAAVLSSGVDEVMTFTPKTLAIAIGKEKAARCTREYDDAIFCTNYHKMGLGAWRAEVLKYALSKVDDGDIVIVHDPNFTKYPGILTGFAPRAYDYATAAMAISDKSGIFLPMCSDNYTLIHTVTRSVMESIAATSSFSAGGTIDEMSNLPCGRCRCMVVRASDATRRFAHAFSNACDDENLMSPPDRDLGGGGGWNRPGFIHHAGDQAVCNALLYTHGYLDPNGRDKWILSKELSNCGIEDMDSGAESLFKYIRGKNGWSPIRGSVALQSLVVYKPPSGNNKIRIGRDNDGGYVICDDDGYDIIISGGISDDTSFELGLLDKFDAIECVAFDGTIPGLPNVKTPANVIAGEDQWVPIKGGGDYIQIGNAVHLLGSSFRDYYGTFPEWAETLDWPQNRKYILSSSSSLISSYGCIKYTSIATKYDLPTRAEVNKWISGKNQNITFVKKNLSSDPTSETNSNLREYLDKYENIFLKLDIEGWEYNLFKSFTDADLNKIKQLVIEFHSPYDFEIQKRLAKTHWLVHVHGNNCRPAITISDVKIPFIYECTYIRKIEGVSVGLNAQPIPDPNLDMGNIKNVPDISLPSGFPWNSSM